MKTKVLIISLFLVVLLFSVPGPSSADEIVKLTEDIVINKDEVINGNVVAISGDIKIFGTVNGDVVAIKGDIHLGDNSTVNGDVAVVTGELFKSPSASVNGDIGRLKKGNVNISSPEYSKSLNYQRYTNHHFSWTSSIMKILGLTALTFLGFTLFSNNIAAMDNWLKNNLGSVFLKGFLGWLALPFLFIALLITIIGIPIAFLSLLFIPISIIIGLWVVGLFTGSKVIPLIKKEWEKNNLIEGVTGVIIVWLAMKAPFIGFLVFPIIAIIGLGVILDSKFGTGKPWFNRKKGDGDNVA